MKPTIDVELLSILNNNLTQKITEWEKIKTIGDIYKYPEIDKIYQNSLEAKKLFSQINTIIHATGILVYLKHILNKSEKIESLSLGAGNTNKQFDVITNIRIAEFKFIDWKKSANTVRENSFFCDYLKLGFERTNKKKEIYINNKNIVLNFLNGSRNIDSVLSRNQNLKNEFIKLYKNKYKTVKDYYLDKKSEVKIIDIEDFHKN